MILIYFTQCTGQPAFHRCKQSKQADQMPVNRRIEFYFENLRSNLNATWYTYDEYLLLVAWQLNKEEQMPIRLISVCGCVVHAGSPSVGEDGLSRWELEENEYGLILAGCHHGFFEERKCLLR